LINNEEYFRKLIFYIHNNPIHHGITNSIEEYPWSSYRSIISLKPTKIKRERVIEIFDDVENFKYYHSINQDLEKIKYLVVD